MSRITEVADELNRQTEIFRSKVAKTNRHDAKFVHKDDDPLTDDEIRQIDAFWGKYKFAYPSIDYDSFKNYKNRCGIFDVRYIPSAVRNYYLTPHFIDNRFLFSYQHKVLIDNLYPDINHPDYVIGFANGIYTDKNAFGIDQELAIEKVYNYLNKNKKVAGVLFKRNNTSGGHGVKLLTRADATKDAIEQLVKRMSQCSYVVQGYLDQSPFMARFNKSSVNTIRITTLMHNGFAHVIAALVRAASADIFVDNWCSGGVLVGIDKSTGKLNKWALTNDLKHISVLPGGLDLSKDLYIPNYKKVVEAVTHCHYRNPYTKMISWDVALNSKNIPTLIECNFGGMIQIHQSTTGPLFGDLTESILDIYLLDKFHLPRVDGEYVVDEYHDHVKIKEYLGEDQHLIVPEKLCGKPVRQVLKNTFINRKDIKSVLIPQIIKENSIDALSTLSDVKIY